MYKNSEYAKTAIFHRFSQVFYMLDVQRAVRKLLKIDYEGFQTQLLVKIACRRCLGACRTRFWRVPGVSWACLGRLVGALKRFLAALGRLLGGFKARLGRIFAALERLWTAKCCRRQARPRFCIDFYSILASFCQAPLAEMPTKALPLSFFFLKTPWL